MRKGGLRGGRSQGGRWREALRLGSGTLPAALSPKPTALPLRPERVRLPDLPACGATGLGWKRVPERCKFGEPALFGKALG